MAYIIKCLKIIFDWIFVQNIYRNQLITPKLAQFFVCCKLQFFLFGRNCSSMACQPVFSQRASELQLTFYAIWLIFQIQNQQNFFQSDENISHLHLLIFVQWNKVHVLHLTIYRQNKTWRKSYKICHEGDAYQTAVDVRGLWHTAGSVGGATAGPDHWAGKVNIDCLTCEQLKAGWLNFLS